MKKLFLILAVLLCISAASYCAGTVYQYHFPKASASWGNPVSFNNLSPGFFQVMYQDATGVVRIATYGIAGGTMDTLKDPQLLMVFTFDQEKTGVASNN